MLTGIPPKGHSVDQRQDLDAYLNHAGLARVKLLLRGLLAYRAICYHAGLTGQPNEKDASLLLQLPEKRRGGFIMSGSNSRF